MKPEAIAPALWSTPSGKKTFKTRTMDRERRECSDWPHHLWLFPLPLPDTNLETVTPETAKSFYIIYAPLRTRVLFREEIKKMFLYSLVKQKTGRESVDTTSLLRTDGAIVPSIFSITWIRFSVWRLFIQEIKRKDMEKKVHGAVLGFRVFDQVWHSKEKRVREKRAEQGQFIPPKQKFNLLASSHHHSSIWLELIQFFLKHAEATTAACNYLRSQLSCDWGGRHRNKHYRCSAALCPHDASTPSCSRDLQNTSICVKYPSVWNHASSSLEDSSEHYCYNKKFSLSQCKRRDCDLWLRPLI